MANSLKSPKKVLLIFLVSGSVLTFVGLVLAVRTIMFLSSAQGVDATVTDIEVSTSDEGNRLYQPTFQFIDLQQVSHTVKLRHAGSGYNYKIGESVAILYDPANPQTIRVDSFFGIWFVTLVLCFIGLGFVGTSLIAKKFIVIANRSSSQRSAVESKQDP